MSSVIARIPEAAVLHLHGPLPIVDNNRVNTNANLWRARA